MSSSNTENFTAVALQDPHHTAAAEATSEDVVISLIVPHQGNEGKTSPNEVEVVGDIAPFDTSAPVAETRGPAEPELMNDTMAPTSTIDPEALKVAALEDATRILGATLSIDLDKVGAKDARIIMSEEHKSLGYRPPPDSLAAKAQRSSTKHPDSSLGLDAATLREAARADAERIKADRTININTLTAEEVRKLQSEEQKALGYRPPPGSLSAEAQSTVDRRNREPVTKGSSSGSKNRSLPQKKRNKRKLNKDPASASIV